MSKSPIESLFEWIDQTTTTIEEHTDESYLLSLITTLEILFYEKVSEEIDDILSYKLRLALKEIDLTMYTTDTIRKAVQLAIVKGMKGTTQPNHMITPESVALFVSYLATKLTNNQKNLRVFDPVCGTAN